LNSPEVIFNVTGWTKYSIYGDVDDAPPDVIDMFPVAGTTLVGYGSLELEVGANIIDDVAVDPLSTFVNITHPDGVTETILPLVNGLDDWYSVLFTAPAYGRYDINFSANDTSLNMNHTEISHFFFEKDPTVIDDCDWIIDVPGVYNVTQDLGPYPGTCIFVRTDDVVIQSDFGNSWTITGSAGGLGVDAIGYTNLTIRDLSITGFPRSVDISGSSFVDADVGGDLFVRNSNLDSVSSGGLPYGPHLISSPYNGGSGGEIIVIDSTVSLIEANGASGLSSPGTSVYGGDAGEVYIYGSSFVNEVYARGGDGSFSATFSANNPSSTDETQSGPGIGLSPDPCEDKGGGGGIVVFETQNINLGGGVIDVSRGFEGDGGTSCSNGAFGRLTLSYSNSFTDIGSDYEGEMLLEIINDVPDGGGIKWLEPVNASVGVEELSVHTDISDNYIFVNGSKFSGEFNKHANLTLRGTPGFGFNPPLSVLKDDITCGDCYNFTSLDASVVVFNVTGFSNYTIGEELIPSVEIIPLDDLASGVILWNVDSTNILDEPAEGNNDDTTSVTGYRALINIQGVSGVDLWLRAVDLDSGDLVHGGGGSPITLDKETYRVSPDDETVPLALDMRNIQTTWTNPETMVNIQDQQEIYFKFYLDVPEGQEYGTYTNNIEFILSSTGTGPPPA